MLLDFYGDLLTARQRECYELHFNEDLSLSEIAEQCGISRQGAWDNIRRASDTMERLEEKTGLIQRTLDTGRHLRHLEKLLNQMETQLGSAVSDKPDSDDRICGDSKGGIARLLREARNEVQTLLKTDN
jgi:hypothetical protein